MKRLVTFFFSIMIMQVLIAQNPLLDSARNELFKINKVFDSSMYLGFDMRILYKSDSATVTVQTDQLDGTYVLNKKNIYYQMGPMQYVQTDSFSYNIYNDEKLMIMTKNMVVQNSDVFPLKNFIDSVISQYAASYTIAIDTAATDSADFRKRIIFTALDSLPNQDVLAPFTMFSIEYNDETYYPSKFQFSFKELTASEDSIPTMYLALKTVTMNFSHFRAVNTVSIFDDSQYTFYNRQRRIYELAEKYASYRFVTSGFENEDPDADYYREVPSGSGN